MQCVCVRGGAVALYHTTRAFAAVLQNGSICSWGELSCGGDCTPAMGSAGTVGGARRWGDDQAVMSRRESA